MRHQYLLFAIPKGSWSKLNRIWWEESDSKIEKHCLEIHRLTLLGKETAITEEIPQGLLDLLHKEAKGKVVSGKLDEAREIYYHSIELIQNIKSIQYTWGK